MRGRPCHSTASEAQDGRGPDSRWGEMTETGGNRRVHRASGGGSAAFGRDARRLLRRGGSLSRVTVVQFSIRPAWGSVVPGA